MAVAQCSSTSFPCPSCGLAMPASGGVAAVGEAVALAGSGQFVGKATDLGFMIAHGAFAGEVLTEPFQT
ncbi:hypothetical protein [Micromonospora sp. NPDC005189]|uniref:hypothetical protein n=1 Tax=unclassified Micromonospora TaxID=2617518 RepID=UPI0033BCCA8D